MFVSEKRKRKEKKKSEENCEIKKGMFGAWEKGKKCLIMKSAIRKFFFCLFKEEDKEEGKQKFPTKNFLFEKKLTAKSFT